MQRLLLPFQTGAIEPPSGPTLALHVTEDAGLDSFAGLRVVQPIKQEHDRLARAGRDVVPALDTMVAQTTLLRMTRSRGETRGLLAQAWMATEPGGLIVISGAKTDGADTMIKDLKKCGLAVETLAKAHGKVMWLTRTTETPEFFREWEITAKARRTPSGYLTAEGLFSADGPDPASELLAAEFGPGLKGQAADLGAGWGYLSAEILKQAPKIEALHLIESDHRAVELARKNVSDDRAEYHWADATRPGELLSLIHI